MKTTKKLSAKTAVKISTVKVSPRLRLLLIALVVSVLLLVAYLFKGYNPDLQQEADGFTKLKQDFLTLQQEFNKIDIGWVYGDGCTGSGGVFDRDKATDCSIRLTNRQLNSPEKLRQYLLMTTNDHLDTFSLKPSENGTNQHYSLSTKYNMVGLSCAIYITADDYNDINDPRYITIACSATAHYFHFPRTDR